ncbi:MAG TPA: NAD-dependent epimerase [Steroidobacteraceae bacterium]|nr:NAD-dependent epimerase [Steroidobacteraceae bacterium]
MKVLVTGAAGFIGYFTAKRLLERGDHVVGLDNLNAYYDVSLKQARLQKLQRHEHFHFAKLDLSDQAAISALFDQEAFQRVVHLAAQAGVRHSLTDPFSYVASNVTGTLTILEGCRHHGVEHLLYASSSSVYGASKRMPFSVHEPAAHPLSLYAASKRSTELMAHSYAALFNVPVTGLRFFTVYGPWGRPDMALFRFARAILEGKSIDVYNFGHHRRDFTYIDDIVEGIVRLSDDVATPNPSWDATNPDPGTSPAPYRLYNIGSSRPIELLRYIEMLEECLGRKARKNMLPMQLGDVPDTFADVSELESAVGYAPQTPVEVGVRRFAEWFREFYGYQ